MSTQDNAGIPLSSAPDGRGYRLLELPPELEHLLLKPSAPVLYLKQPEDGSTAVLTNPEGKDYSLQQKNTSNALLLLAPSTNTGDDPSAPAGVTAVATLHETIELVTEAPNAAQKERRKWHERFGRNR